MQRKKIGKSNHTIHAVDKDVQLDASSVLSSWTNNTFLFPEEKNHQGKVIRKGFRSHNVAPFMQSKRIGQYRMMPQPS